MGIIDRKEREKEKRRNDIIDAAERVFFAKNVDNVTVDDVAEEAELSKGTIYLYFKNKEDLYRAIILRGMALFQSMMSEAADRCQTGIEKLYSIAIALYEFYKNYPQHFEALFYHGLTKLDLGSESHLNEDLMKKSDEMLQFAVDCLKTGIEDGSIRPDINPYLTALSLQGLLTGLIRVVSLEEDHMMKYHNVSSEELINHSFNLIGYSLKGPNAPCPTGPEKQASSPDPDESGTGRDKTKQGE